MFQEFPASAKSLASRKLVRGVGVNDSDYKTMMVLNGKQIVCPFYRKWLDMIERCYSASFQEKAPTYIGCSVCDGWLVFTTFKLWMIKQDWQGKQLDKDILFQGNKIYSPESCLFVSRQINSMLLDSKSIRGEHPIGVHFNKSTGKYVSKVGLGAKQKYLGVFDTPKEASEAYKIAKYAHIKEVALNQTEPLRSALLNYKIK